MDYDLKYLWDCDLCLDCLEGKRSAIETLQRTFGAPTISYLIGVGAQPAEAKDVVARLWSDLLVPRGDRPPRLRLYDGSCALQTWLNTVALNELFSRKRTQQRWRELMAETLSWSVGGEDRAEPPEDWLVDPAADEPSDAPLIKIVRSAINAAFLSCASEDFVLLHLKHCEGIRGAELALLFGCNESAISRRIRKAEKYIAGATLGKIRETDPWLQLQWSDFLNCCRTAKPSTFRD